MKHQSMRTTFLEHFVEVTYDDIYNLFKQGSENTGRRTAQKERAGKTSNRQQKLQSIATNASNNSIQFVNTPALSRFCRFEWSEFWNLHLSEKALLVVLLEQRREGSAYKQPETA